MSCVSHDCGAIVCLVEAYDDQCLVFFMIGLHCADMW